MHHLLGGRVGSKMTLWPVCADCSLDDGAKPSEFAVPNDRVRAFALWEGCFGYDRKKYVAMLREAFEPFGQFTLDRISLADSNDPRLAEELVRFLLFAAMKFPRPGV